MEGIYQQLADLLEVENIDNNDILAEFECWDSLTMLSIIALASENYGKQIGNEQIREKKTVAELIELIIK